MRAPLGRPGVRILGHETKTTATADIAMGKKHLGRVEAEDELAHHYVVRGLHRSSWRRDAIGRFG